MGTNLPEEFSRLSAEVEYLKYVVDSISENLDGYWNTISETAENYYNFHSHVDSLGNFAFAAAEEARNIRVHLEYLRALIPGAVMPTSSYSAYELVQMAVTAPYRLDGELRPWPFGNFAFVQVDESEGSRSFREHFPPDDESLDQLDVVIYADVNANSKEFSALYEAVDNLAGSLGYGGPELVEESKGSIFRRETWRRWFGRDDVKKRIEKVEHLINLKYVTSMQAQVDLTASQALLNVVQSLGPIDNACVRVGSILVVKFRATDGSPVVLARTLSVAEMVALDKFPEIQHGDPGHIFTRLSNAVVTMNELNTGRRGPDEGGSSIAD